MFVDRLDHDQVKSFLREHLKEDINPQVTRFQSNFVFIREGEPAEEIFYNSKIAGGNRSIFLMDDMVTPLVTKDFENAWIRYLYSIFGEEYKEWFMKRKEDLFN